ncbi:serine/threonine-protein phosphatase 2A activator-like [Branchiostoma floridae x Branchiostoma japonicum]
MAEKSAVSNPPEDGGEKNERAESSSPEHKFSVPKREITSPMHMGKWQKSQAHRDYMGFVLTLNEAVKGKSRTCECHISEPTEKLLGILDTLDGWVDETPPVEQPQRFGNKAYRTWFQRLEENVESLVQPLLPEKYHTAAPEIAVYLREGVGNKTRIDYGTGHEAAFTAFLCCLFKLRIFTEKDMLALVFRVFHRYLEVMRKLQTVYRMEPAGSQGVWGLDDFQFLPFLWGSSQLMNHPTIEPKHFPQLDTVQQHHTEYMFLDCIRFINTMKTGPFAEHSHTLWGISGVPYWGKVNSGLIKMYKAEVLNKFPVIQHFLFGSLLSIQPA